MIIKDIILDFNNKLKTSLEELEQEIAECEHRIKDLHQRREIVGRTHEAITGIVGKDDRPQPEPEPQPNEKGY